MKRLGLIGGTSWYTTEEYYRFINEGISKQTGNMESPELLIFCINIAVMRSQNREKIQATYLETAKKLENAGAEAVVICANTPHMVVDHVQPQIGIPFLHIARATGNEAKRSGLTKLGLLGTKPVMTGDFISGILQNEYGIEVMIPTGSDLETSHEFVAEELTKGVFSEKAKSFFLEEIDKFKRQGADGVVLGCTEIPILLKGMTADLPLLSTTHLHAQMAVDFITEKQI